MSGERPGQGPDGEGYKPSPGAYLGESPELGPVDDATVIQGPVHLNPQDPEGETYE